MRGCAKSEDASHDQRPHKPTTDSLLPQSLWTLFESVLSQASSRETI